MLLVLGNTLQINLTAFWYHHYKSEHANLVEHYSSILAYSYKYLYH